MNMRFRVRAVAKRFLIIVAVFLLLWTLVGYDTAHYFNEVVKSVTGLEYPYFLDRFENGYKAKARILNSSACKIPNFDPYDKDVMKMLKRESIG